MPPGHVKLGYDFHGQLLKEVTRRYKERFLFGTTLYEAERSLRASVPSGPVGKVDVGIRTWHSRRAARPIPTSTEDR